MILSISRVERLAELAAGCAFGFMPMARPIAGWPLKRNSGCGGSTIAAGDGGDVARAEEAVVDAQVDAAQALLGRELRR